VHLFRQQINTGVNFSIALGAINATMAEVGRPSISPSVFSRPGLISFEKGDSDVVMSLREDTKFGAMELSPRTRSS
jgi:hypothetical protein